MKEITVSRDFDVDEITSRINSIIFIFKFQLDFNDLETRIKLEDLKLNVIHHIEGLKDETAYRDNLINAVFFD